MSMRARVIDGMTLIATACAMIATATLVSTQLGQRRRVVEQRAGSRDRQNRVIENWSTHFAAGRVGGSERAPLKILYFGDYECPACGSFQEQLRKLQLTHPDDVQVSFRHFPLDYHRFAGISAKAAECAAVQDRFEEMHDALYEKQDSLGLLPFTEMARRAGVPDLKRFEVCLNDSHPFERIEADRRAARELGIPGTPGVIINGTLMLDRVLSAEELEKLVAEERSKR